MDQQITLKKWKIVAKRLFNSYLPPERRLWTFSGEIYGHNNFPDGYEVTLSTPIEIDMPTRLIKTSNGNRFLLEGAPDPGWVAYLFTNNYSVQQYIDILNQSANNLSQYWVG